jgi:hypothetical protein
MEVAPRAYPHADAVSPGRKHGKARPARGRPGRAGIIACAYAVTCFRVLALAQLPSQREDGGAGVPTCRRA